MITSRAWRDADYAELSDLLELERPSLGRLLDRLETKGWVRFDRFDYGALRAHFLILEGRVWGEPMNPRLDLQLDGAAVRVAGYPIGNGKAVITGGPKEYLANGEFRAPGERRAEFRARVEEDDSVYRLNVDTVELAVGELSWRGSVNDLTLDVEEGVKFDRILMGKGSQRLEATGSWAFNGPDDIRADLQNFDLAVLKILYPEQALDFEGGVDLHFEFRGDLDKDPTIVAEGTLTDATLDITTLTGGATEPAYIIASYNTLTGAFATVTLANRWSVQGEARAFALEFDRYEGTMGFFAVRLERDFGRYFAAGIGFNTDILALQLGVDDQVPLGVHYIRIAGATEAHREDSVAEIIDIDQLVGFFAIGRGGDDPIPGLEKGHL